MVQEYVSLSNWSLLGIISAVSFKFIFILLFSILLYSWKFLSEKEQQQSEFVLLEAERLALHSENEKLKIANESHIDTIQSLTKKLDRKKKKVAKQDDVDDYIELNPVYAVPEVNDNPFEVKHIGEKQKFITIDS